MVDDWSLIPNINALVFEMSPHFRDKVKNWNMSVQAWLQKSIYYRYRTAEQYQQNRSDAAKGQLLVFMVSAFWHGFYGGYYLSFFFWYNVATIINIVFKLVQRNPQITETFNKFGIVGRVVAWTLSSIGMTYFAVYF
jgi:lysophospholipid acyltransferase